MLSRIFGGKAKAAESEYRPGPYLIDGGFLSASAGKFWNFWQMGYSVRPFCDMGAMVEACVSAYAQTVAMCPGDHWRSLPDGGRERVTNSALTRILRRPNPYESISDFFLNVTRDLYLEGNAYAYAVRNDRFEISELHLMDPRISSAQIADTGDVFYALRGNGIIDRRFGMLPMVPARDVLHIRLHRSRNKLRGESPLSSARMDVAGAEAISAQQLQFYLKGARPGMVFSTPLDMKKDQVQAVRDRIRQVSEENETLILTAGLKPERIQLTNEDAQTAEMLKAFEQHIALAFRVPLQMLGIGGAPFGSTEALILNWKSGGLGFCLNHIEEAFGNLFQLKGQPDEYLELNVNALLRPEFKDRVDAYVRGVQGTIWAPNEARAEFEMGKKPFGDEPDS